MFLFKQKTKEDGFVLVTCMMMMVVLTIIGIMAVSTTETELMIAGNDKVSKSAFFRADSGIFTAPKVIREVVENGPATHIETFPIDGVVDGNLNDYYRRMMGFITGSGNINFTQGEGTINTVMSHSGSVPLEGESREFAAGYGGSTSGEPPTGELYSLVSTGTAPGNATSQIEALYKYIPGRPGGL